MKYKNAFLSSLKEAGRTESTLNRYLVDLNDFSLWVSVQQELLGNFEVTGQTIQQYFDFLVNEKKYSFASTKRIRTVLNQYFKFLIKNQIITENPISIQIDQGNLKTFSPRDFVKDKEIEQFIRSIQSTNGLSEKQIPSHQYLNIRNHAIILLFFKYGLTLKEVVHLKKEHVDFYQNDLHIDGNLPRTLIIYTDDKKILYRYFESIPKAVRPRDNSIDPFFVAFDFARNTYRWDFQNDQPKCLSEIAIQKMIRKELARAGIRPEISAQHLRRTAILNALKGGNTHEQINHQFGFRATNSLLRYLTFLEGEKEKTQATS